MTRGHAAAPLARAGAVLAVVVAFDQATKAAVRSGVDDGASHELIPGVLRIVDVRNDGVAFGALGGHPIVIVIVLAALAGLIAWFAAHLTRPLVWLPTGLLLGGALGNVVDRVRDGAVTDFVKFPAWPAFNGADVAITFGVLSLLVLLERGDAAHDRA